MADRPTPPPLEPRAPDCPLCHTEVSLEDSHWYCDTCGCEWPYDDWDACGEWRDPDAQQCTEERQPFTLPEHAEFHSHRYRCILDLGHDGWHYGVRIAPSHDSNDIFDWRQGEPATSTAAVPGGEV